MADIDVFLERDPPSVTFCASLAMGATNLSKSVSLSERLWSLYLNGQSKNPGANSEGSCFGSVGGL